MGYMLKGKSTKMEYKLKGEPTKKEAWVLAGANPKISKRYVWELQLKDGHKASNNYEDYKEVEVWSGDYIITSIHIGEVFKSGVRTFERNVIVKANKIMEVED